MSKTVCTLISLLLAAGMLSECWGTEPGVRIPRHLYDTAGSIRKDNNLLAAQTAGADTESAAAPASESKSAPAPEPEPLVVKQVTRMVLHVNFDVDKAEIRKEDAGMLEIAVAFVTEHPEASFYIEGHSDGDGSAVHNRELSVKRAEAVKSYLLAKGGFDKAHFTVSGYGSEFPISTNKTKEGKSKNRRVDMMLLSE
ncbi:MAG: OmpA family protein [Thermodesulfovibrionales bacterium]